MLSFCRLAVALLAARAASALPAATLKDGSHAARAGPSGYVVYPPGGTTFEYIPGGIGATSGDGGGYIHIKYQGVSQDSPFVVTASIDVYLLNAATGQTSVLAENIGTPTAGGLIEAYFIPPLGICGLWGSGTYQLAVREYQNLGGGTLINFLAAAPYINIVCQLGVKEYRSLHEVRNTSLVERGPSGYVVYPPGGTTFELIGPGVSANDGAGGGYIHVQYQGVTGTDGIVTAGVDVYLLNKGGGGVSASLAFDIGMPSVLGGLIDAYFIPPTEACGAGLTDPWTLAFYEYQSTGDGNVYSFLAAAPEINIACVPVQ